MLEINQVYCMDCLEGLKLLDDNSIDSIVTDPPYNLSFMNLKWDNSGIAYNTELWKECLRVVKPGGHMLVAGIGRTHHRMMVAIEDAGWEIRDCIYHIFGSGFPKSLDISKAIDKELGAQRKVVRTKYARDFKEISGGRYGDKNTLSKNTDINITAPATPEATQWEGWGTGLKPAVEIWVLARKPISEKNIALNVLRWGTGGINIDDCRIPTSDSLTGGALTGSFSASEGWDRPWRHDEEIIKQKITETKNKVAKAEELGRFPANLILSHHPECMQVKSEDTLEIWNCHPDCPIKILDKQSGITKSGKTRKNKDAYESESVTKFLRGVSTVTNQHGDSGGASRFFYCAKPSPRERGEFNKHPTVKPVKLIEYLAKLVTPPNGICLDPFMGSGTTAISCKNVGVNYIGFEKEEEYMKIIDRRIN